MPSGLVWECSCQTVWLIECVIHVCGDNPIVRHSSYLKTQVIWQSTPVVWRNNKGHVEFRLVNVATDVIYFWALYQQNDQCSSYHEVRILLLLMTLNLFIYEEIIINYKMNVDLTMYRLKKMWQCSLNKYHFHISGPQEAALYIFLLQIQISKIQPRV